MKIFVASFNRAESALQILKDKLQQHNMLASSAQTADYILISGDRCEMFNFALDQYLLGRKIIHLWAGEIDGNFSTHDEVYRHTISMFSVMQLCTNQTSKDVVDNLFHAIGKKPNSFVVGNLMLDDLKTDSKLVPDDDYTLILYNPPCSYDDITIKRELLNIDNMIKKIGKKHIWIEPNGDFKSDIIKPYVTHKNLPRAQFLGLMKHSYKFLTNSSCQFYEAPFLMNKKDIISIGVRNSERNSKYARMDIPNAAENIINILKEFTKKQRIDITKDFNNPESIENSQRIYDIGTGKIKRNKVAEERFPNWKRPEFDEKNMTKYNWVCQHHKNLSLGKGSDIGAFTYINAYYKIRIDEKAQIGSHCSIYSISTIDNKVGSVLIKKNAKVGTHSTIMPGVTVGENSIVAAHSFVKANTKIPDNEIYAGVPAKFMRKIECATE